MPPNINLIAMRMPLKLGAQPVSIYIYKSNLSPMGAPSQCPSDWGPLENVILASFPRDLIIPLRRGPPALNNR